MFVTKKKIHHKDLILHNKSSTAKQVNDFTFPEKFLYLSHCSLDCFIRHSSEHVLIYSVNKIVIYNELLLMCESHWWNI